MHFGAVQHHLQLSLSRQNNAEQADQQHSCKFAPVRNAQLALSRTTSIARPRFDLSISNMTLSMQAMMFPTTMMMKQAELLLACFSQHICQLHCREQICETVRVYLLLRQSALKLILLEGVLYDILHVLAGVLHSAHEVEQSVVTQLEGTQQRRRLAGHNLPAPHSRHSLDSSSLKLICKP